MTLLMPLTLLIPACVCAKAQAPVQRALDATAFEFRPGVIADPGGQAVYIMSPERGITAVNLVSGGVLWRTELADKPLLSDGDLLVAQSETTPERQGLHIALLNTQDVNRAPRFIEVPLPEDVHVGIDDYVDSSFSVAAHLHEGACVLSWRYDHSAITGPPPRSEGDATVPKSGNVLIDIKTGKTRPLGDPTALSELKLPASVSSFKEAVQPPRTVWRVNDVFAAIDLGSPNGEQMVTLKRWDVATGEELAGVKLFDGGLVFRSISADEHHLLASRRHAAGHSSWEWVVYSLETGRRVAQVRQGTPGARFFLFRSLLIVETNVDLAEVGSLELVEPGKLCAVDIETEMEVWSHALRDTEYRGPRPP
jgi:hypothetical protein